MYCSHSIVFRSTTSEASINRISFNQYRVSFNLHHSVCNYYDFEVFVMKSFFSDRIIYNPFL
ncbi:hypothetical protein HanXRQr2_Chr01g0020711 [Helianthus annuus]|uniref:Uncharacterized protein n=1 Tax=Helianthus annuus TaxID=4232 RepID=A0A251UG09_HELAN|nr:hypothetical protein HanXRQr2_Chr01g0020711 [Helianthus annuus]KAJ0626831.1 hypothetical protein HanHA89_Chr01g0018471 [Helianthus annuus]